MNHHAHNGYYSCSNGGGHHASGDKKNDGEPGLEFFRRNFFPDDIFYKTIRFKHQQADGENGGKGKIPFNLDVEMIVYVAEFGIQVCIYRKQQSK
jgi:hypothetical protein